MSHDPPAVENGSRADAAARPGNEHGNNEGHKDTFIGVAMFTSGKDGQQSLLQGARPLVPTWKRSNSGTVFQ